jgi:hypothetical protein
MRTSIASAAAERARERRHALFLEHIDPKPTDRIVDVGCGPLGLRAWAPNLDVTGVDVRPRPDYPGPFVCADATQPLPFADQQFDLAFSNSLIEHLPRASRAAFAAEIQRIARGWWVQTPAYSFPVEPHALLPAAHWLPLGLRKKYWRFGVAGEWEQIDLLRRSEMLALFGEPVIPERVGPLVKSWIAIRRP